MSDTTRLKAFLITPRHGGGFPAEADRTDGRLIAAKLTGRSDEWADRMDEFDASCDMSEVKIVYIPAGRPFIVREYDGAESVQFIDEIEWTVL